MYAFFKKFFLLNRNSEEISFIYILEEFFCIFFLFSHSNKDFCVATDDTSKHKKNWMRGSTFLILQYDMLPMRCNLFTDSLSLYFKYLNLTS